MNIPDSSTVPAKTPADTAPAESQADESRVRPTPAPGVSSPPRLYPAVWRWHFYAGLFVAPIFLVITVTGALYVFRTELTNLRDHSILFVEPQSERLGYDELREIAARATAPRKLEAVIVHPEANRSVRFVAEMDADDDHDHEAHQHLIVYMNPYTGEILDQRIAEHDFFAIVLDIHRSLMLGTPGRVVGELATSWGLLLLATGVFLWWPRGKKNVGVWLPRVRGKLYSVLRDWHAVAGIYLMPLAFLIIGTGMFFTVVWGSGFVQTIKAAGHIPPGWFGDKQSPPPAPDAKPASLDKVVATVLAEGRPQDTISIVLAGSPEVAHKAWYLQDENKNTYNMLAVDQYSGEGILSVKCNEVPPLYKARMLAVSIHMGQIFGMPTKILALLTSFGLMGLVVTGLWMWWTRRPTGRSGFPRRPKPGSVPVWGWIIIVCCGVLLPVAGASILLIMIVDRVLLAIRRQAPSPAG
ncbi:MAG: PepSY-associated TM helix domain-containing protein [Maioricimonas sp. JB045]